MRRKLVLSALAGLTLAAPALAGPADDYAAVHADWQNDRRISPCRFSEEELQNARKVSDSNPDDAYTGFPAAVDTELARRRGRGCAGRTPDSVRATSALRGVRIVSVSGRGSAASETVALRNRGRRTADVGRATIRNRTGERVTLPRGVRIGRGGTLKVTIGCRRGRAVVRRTRAWTCSRRALFADSGDVARLADREGVVVSQRGFGSFRRRPAF